MEGPRPDKFAFGVRIGRVVDACRPVKGCVREWLLSLIHIYPLGRRKYIYANDLVTLREKEAQLTKDQMDGLDIYVAGKATVNFVFDRYMSLKTNLRQTTRSNYLYMYDRFIRDTFGKKKIAEIRYSDVLQFYNYLLDKQG